MLPNLLTNVATMNMLKFSNLNFFSNLFRPLTHEYKLLSFIRLLIIRLFENMITQVELLF
jgi:hypothetical protein